MTVFGILLAIRFDFGLADVELPLLLALMPLAILCPDIGLGVSPIFLLWALYLGLMAVSLQMVRKARDRRSQTRGRIAVFILFGIIYAVGWYFVVEAIGSALAGAAIFQHG